MLKSQKNVIISILEFRNINIISKGQYRLAFQVYIDKKALNIQYKFQNTNYYKDDPLNQTSIKGECSQQQAQSTFKSQNQKAQLDSRNFQTMPFFIKYYNQKIKMNYLALFSGDQKTENAIIRISLLKKDPKKYCDKFTCVQEVLINFNSSQTFIQYYECSFTQSFSSVIKLVIFSSPIFQIEQKVVIQKNLSIKLKYDQKQLVQFRKQIKKYRYNNYLLGKAIDEILLHPISHSLKLPLFFVTKQHSMDQVQSSQKMFFKYLTIYQKTQTTISMLKQQIQHLALNRRCLLKHFIDSFEKTQLLIGILLQKAQKNKMLKYINFVIQTQIKISLNELLKIVAKEQIQYKKDKIKQWKKTLNKKVIQINQNVKTLEDIRFNQFINNKDIIFQKKQFEYPLIFYQCFYIQASQFKEEQFQSIEFIIKNAPKRKIFILAHGFQGLPSDLSYLTNQIKKKFYKAKFLVLKSYKNKMEGNIQQMAKKIGFQISQFLQGLNSKEVQDQITMIGHSMGSIILRSALKYLHKYKRKLNCFISLCSPHLGYIQGTKFLTDTGLSLISKIKPIQSLLQVSNRDNQNLQETFIFELSKQGSLVQFKQIILVSSIEDNYVPWHSARIEPFNQEKGKGWIQRQMIANILGVDNPDSKIKNICRVDVHFQTSNKCFSHLDSWIGRISHIKPLVDLKFIQIFVNKILN